MLLHAPAKLNLCLYLGPRRDDGLHEICSLFEPLSLADRLRVSEAERDEVICPGVDGDELAGRALAALRARGWGRPPLRIEVDKEIPVAAGLGGGSADAAAVLRLAGEEIGDVESLAAGLGADVPSQLDPRLALVRGAGERVEPLPEPATHWVVLVPAENGLATAEVFAAADRLDLRRSESELESLAGELRRAAADGASPLSYASLLANDLEPAAQSLRPAIAAVLDELRGAGAAHAALTGSGPTAFGMFAERDGAERAAQRLGGERTIVCAAGSGR